MSHDAAAALPITSSHEPRWAPEARSCYRDVLLALRQAGVPFAVGGAFAVHRHTGIWRVTKDLDLLLLAESVPEALRCLGDAGFEIEIKDPVWLAKARRGEHFVDLITGMGNAVFSVDASWLERAEEDVVLDVPCRVLAAEELIASKVFVTRRERFDGADVVHLVQRCGAQLDWERLLTIIGRHWGLLFWSLTLFAYVYPAQTDVVPATVWKRLTDRFTAQVEHPNKDEPFRGSLVDPRMFAIDVEEWGERNLYQESCERVPCLLQMEDETETNA